MIALLLAASLLQGAPAISKDAFDLKELNRLEAVWNEAHLKGDAEALDRLWSNDLIVTVSSMPVMNKADALAMVRSGRMTFLKYETSEVNVKRFVDSALVTGRLRRVRSMAGKEVADDYRFTKMYVLREGRWQVVAWHASPSAP